MSAGLPEVPAFWVEAGVQRRVPCVVSLYMVDGEGVGRLTPAVEQAINRVVDATGRQGLATAIVLDVPGGAEVALRGLVRAMGMDGVIVLFRCQSVEGSERLMNLLHATYSLTLLRAA